MKITRKNDTMISENARKATSMTFLQYAASLENVIVWKNDIMSTITNDKKTSIENVFSEITEDIYPLVNISKCYLFSKY